MVRGNLPSAGAVGLDLAGVDAKLAPQGVNILLLVVHAGKLHHVVADSRVCAIGANHDVKVNFHLARAAARGESVAVLDPGLALAKVGAGELVVKVEFYIGEVLEGI